MTEAEWDGCTDPERMLYWIADEVSKRKLRLFACACLRQSPRQPSDSRGRRAIEVAEQVADGFADEEALRVEWLALGGFRGGWDAEIAVRTSVRAAALEASQLDVGPESARLLRDIFGNPFCAPPPLDPAWLAWNDGAVERLTWLAYEERQLPNGHLDPARLAILADALEESGCTDADILAHLRGSGPHCRGCWAVDLLLGQE